MVDLLLPRGAHMDFQEQVDAHIKIASLHLMTALVFDVGCCSSGDSRTFNGNTERTHVCVGAVSEAQTRAARLARAVFGLGR